MTQPGYYQTGGHRLQRGCNASAAAAGVAVVGRWWMTSVRGAARRGAAEMQRGQ